MTEETTPQDSASTENAPPNAAPEADLSFKEHVKWRMTGELPAAKSDPEPAPAAAEPEGEPPAKTDPQSGAEDTQQQQEEEEEEEAEGEQTGAARRRRGARERRIDRLTRENEQLRQQLTAQTQPPPAKPQPPPGKPQLAQFDTLEEYQEALSDWNLDQREAKRREEADQKAAREAEQKLQTEWDSRQQAARKLHADYDDVIESVTAPEGPGVLAARMAMLEDDAGAEILYHLAKHPAELKRIAALPPIAASREIGRLSAILSPPPSGAANGKQKFSAAPKPPPPSTRPAKPVSESIFDPAVQSDFKRWSKARAQMKD